MLESKAILVRAVAFLAFILLPMLVVPTHAGAAESAPQAFDISPQSLATALSEFARQSQRELLFTPELVAEKTTPGVQGTLEPLDALAVLLKNTGINFSTTPNGAILLRNKNSIAATGVIHLAQSESSENSNNQDDPDNKNDRGDSSSEEAPQRIQEIVVTAQKRIERLIDTPQSVSVLSSESLAKLGATQFRDFANTVPGLTFTTHGAGYTQVTLRGVTSGQDTIPTVGIYVDDVPFGSSSGFAQGAQLGLDVGLFDVERIEVLRGPQGTLYGASTMGGLMKYVSKQPRMDAFGIDARTGISGTQDGGVSYNGAIAVNAPIVDGKSALRASAFYTHDGGFIDNVTLGREDVDRAEIIGGRADLLLAPTDALNIRLDAFVQNISRDGQATADFSYGGVPLDGELEQRRGFAEPFEQRFRLVSGTVSYDFAAATLSSISSYQTIDTEVVYDFTSAPIVGALASFGFLFSAVAIPQDLETKKFTQEVRLASRESESVEWLLGAFYTDESSENVQIFALRDLAGQPVPNDLYTYSGPTTYDESAAFGNVTYHFNDRFDASAGIRYATNRQHFVQIGSGLLIGSTEPRSSEENVSTYLANARYHFSDRATGYLRYATGYRPGGPNFVANDPTTGESLAPPTFEADRLKSYEIGYKAETSDRRFGVDIALYDIDWSNIQILTQRGLAVYTNAPGGAEIRGAELSVTARPLDRLTASGAFAYQDAKMSNADIELGAAEGERLPNVPRFTASVSGDYALPISGWSPSLGATVRYVSDRWASFNAPPASPQYRMPEYTSVDLRTELTLNTMSLQLYVHNLFDERGQFSAYTNRGPARPAILQPRTFGVSLTTQF